MELDPNTVVGLLAIFVTLLFLFAVFFSDALRK